MRRRIIPAAVSAALLVTGLTACTSAESPATVCENPLQPGVLSNAVTGEPSAIGEGANDILNAQRSLIVEAQERSDTAAPGGIVVADVTLFDAVTGQVLDEREGAPHLALPEDLIGEASAALSSSDSNSIGADFLIAAALLCTAPGDSVAVAMTPQQAQASQLGSDAIAAVIAVRSVFRTQAEGSERALPNGFPAIAVNDAGRPGVVLPPASGPSEARVAPRVLGTGEEITAESMAIGQALTVDWSGEVVQNTWESGLVAFGTEAEANPTFPFREQLTGYPVGSQVVILDPGEGEPVVHVVDILAAS
ncbi:hypothetical protein J4H92_11375 [Leucobacter weissii]|uniref:Peptidylprolyl isomerase n=1 Tax=Leucobacter weissii TaxID=1983706 RepID=A0A939SB23_9MICO|nr:hypothetical protein [Leucobacter weissii]MBO1902547.1 hypothetical protein [Leucobacter weissii]